MATIGERERAKKKGLTISSLCARACLFFVAFCLSIYGALFDITIGVSW